MSDNRNYSRLLKSSSVMGGAAVVVMAITFVRTKFAAEFLGSDGVGIIASYAALQAFVTTLSGLGLATSAVREISIGAGTNESTFSTAVHTLRRLSRIFGFLGLLILIGLSPLLSVLTFGNSDYVFGIASLGLVVLLVNLTSAHIATLQGAGRIGNIAKANVLGTLFATAIAVFLYWQLGPDAIVPAIIVTSFVQYLFAFHFSRKVKVAKVALSWKSTFSRGRIMMMLGFSLMWSGLLSTFVIYVTVFLINQRDGLETSGIYSAAFVVSGAFVGFVLTAMGVDYYPHLVQQLGDNNRMSKLVNQQTEIGLLMSIPGLLGTVFFAEILIKLLYSAEFLPAVSLIHWFVIGAFFRIIAFPMSYVIIATGKSGWAILAESVFHVLNLLLMYVGLMTLGVVGVSIAFAVAYSIYTVVVYTITRRLIDFAWTRSSLIISSSGLAVITGSVLLSYLLDTFIFILIGIPIVLVALVLCLRGLVSLVGSDNKITQFVLRLPGMRFLVTPPKQTS